jgi:hypothetical protein
LDKAGDKALKLAAALQHAPGFRNQAFATGLLAAA